MSGCRVWRGPGWCTRSAHRSAICSGPMSSTAAATSRPRTIWWGRRRSAGVGDDEFVAPREGSWRRASSEADSHGQCNFRGFEGCHAEWIPALEVGAAGVVRPGAWGPAEAGGAESPRFGYTAFTIDAYAGADPRLGMFAVAERIMLRGNRYALVAALDGVPLQPWVQRCTAVIPGVCAGEPAGGRSRSALGATSRQRWRIDSV